VLGDYKIEPVIDDSEPEVKAIEDNEITVNGVVYVKKDSQK
jgi:hypothetical protein